MADLVTVQGGAKQGIKSLSAAEHQAAIKALSKLSDSSASHGVSSVFGGTLKSATLSGGSVHAEGIKLAGGVHGATTPAFGSIGSDTVVAGSAFSSKGESSAASGAAKAHPLSLSGDTINVAKTTAAGVKSDTVKDSKAGHTITLSDKTTITLTGVAPHDVTKPH